MEVLQHSPSGHGQSRRRQDASSAIDRRLDWSSCDNDVLLLPVSPCSIDTFLTGTGVHIDLLPLTSGEPDGTASHPAGRLPLRTQHSASDLQALCKRVLVDNALIKQRGQRTLYLVAGFLELPAKEGTCDHRRAPLLLYPAILSRRVDQELSTRWRTRTNEADAAISSADASTEQIRPDDHPVTDQVAYELRLESLVPAMNDTLLEHCRTQYGVELPDFTAEGSLTQYFARLSHTLKASPEINCTLEMALGSWSADARLAEIQPMLTGLPELPPHFDAELALMLADAPSLAVLDQVLQVLDATDAGTLITNSPGAPHAPSSRGRLHDYSLKLLELNLGHIELRRLSTLPQDLDRWCSSVRESLRCELITDVLDAPTISARQLARLGGIMELLDKAPARLGEYGHADLSYRGTPALLRRARHQARLIDEEVKSIQSWFNFDKVPGRHRLLQLLEALESGFDRDPELIGASYFNARRQFMEFSVDKPTQLDAEHLERLQQLTRLLRFRELFVNNTEYRLAFGPGYRGLRTDWPMLEQSGAFARELAEAMASETLAGRALAQWSGFRRAYVTALGPLQRAGEDLRKILWVLGTEWQKQETEQVLVMARGVMVPLAELQESFADVVANLSDGSSGADNTPAATLAHHGSPSLPAEDAHQLERSREHIQQQLQLSLLTPVGITDTVGWLRAARLALEQQAAGETEPAIERLVEHLHGLRTG